MNASRLVDVPTGRQSPVREHLRIEAYGTDPGPVGRPLGRFRDTRDEVGYRGYAGIADVDRCELGTGEREMVVRVDEAGQDRSATDVDHLSVGRRRGADGIVAPDRHDPLRGDGDAAR